MARKPLIALGIAACVALTCGCSTLTTTVRPGPTTDKGAIRRAGDVTFDRAAGNYSKDQRIGAMMAVRANAVFDKNALEDALEKVPLMPLSDAADILADDAGVRAESRKRRAIAMLVAAKRVRRELLADVDQRQQIDRALSKLGMTPKSITVLMQAGDDYGPVPPENVGNEQPWFEMVYTILVVKKFPVLFPALLAAPCQWTPEPPAPTVTSPFSPPPLVLKTKVSVDRPLTEVGPHIDPQRWDECSEFWDPPPNATRLVKWSGKQAGPLPFTPTAGTHRPDLALLHETFGCGMYCGNSYFDLLICTTTSCDPPAASGGEVCPGPPSSYTVSYQLPQGLAGDCKCKSSAGCPPPGNANNSLWWIFDSSVLNEEATPIIDEGWVRASNHPTKKDHTVVEALKRLNFDPAKYTKTLAFVLAGYLNEMNQELGELACCY